MTQKVQLLRSGVAGHVPAPGGILPGELALNLPDKRLFGGDAAGVAIDFQAVITQAALSATVLTGLSTAAATPITGSDVVLSALGKLQAQLSSATVSVLAFGADPTGAADSAPALRAALGSNRVIVIPPGTYRLASTQTPPPSNFDNACVLGSNLSNFAILGYGATLVVDNAIALSSALHFDRCAHFSVRGLTIQGTRSGLTAGQENVAFTVSSCTDFLADTLHFTGNFGGQGAGIAADWLIDGTFQNIQMDAVGQMADVAFCRNVTFRGVRGRGADTNGLSGAGQIGSKGLSFINDIPNAATNHTGVAFSATRGVLIEGCSATNFATGCYITSGTDYVLTGNLWADNPGLGGALGIGVLIAYANGGAFSSVGVPPGNILINGDRFVGNGAVTAGAGVLLDPSAIANSDLIANVAVTNCLFDNNNATALHTTSAAHLANINLTNNSFSGALQVTNIIPGLAGVAGYYTMPSGMGIPGNLILRNNVSLQALDGSGAPQPVLVVSPANVTVLRPGSASAYIEAGRYDGTPVLRLTNAPVNPVYIAVDSAMRNVVAQPDDSGGPGYRMLVVPN